MADGCSGHQSSRRAKHRVGYFKRSFVKREEGSYVRKCTNDQKLLPLAFCGAGALVNKNPRRERKFLFSNLLCPSTHKSNKNRVKIIGWTFTFAKSHNYTKDQFLIGILGSGQSDSDWSRQFLEHLANTKIIITCNPNGSEGDFRLWEALLSGALIFVDKMTTLDWLPHPFVHKKHLIFHDSTNQTEFDELLGYYYQKWIWGKTTSTWRLSTHSWSSHDNIKSIIHTKYKWKQIGPSQSSVLTLFIRRFC